MIRVAPPIDHVSLDPRFVLRLIADRGCERVHRPEPGQCFLDGQHVVSVMGTVDQVCDPCLAWAALRDGVRL